MLHVSDKQVPEDSCLIQVAQANHVLQAVHGGGVHVRQLPRPVHPMLLPVIILIFMRK